MTIAPQRDQPGRSPQGPAGPSSGLLVPGNINLNKRPIVHNADGSYSTVRSITITDGGKAILIPTVVGKKVVSNEQAIRHYQNTGQHLGIFDSESDADAYAETLHDAQAKEYGARAGMPTGPPQPALQAVGFNGSIHDFNQRLEAVAQAHTAATGTRPSPGLALDVARSPVPAHAFGPLFAATPLTATQARAQTALATANPNDEIIAGIKQAIQDGKLATYMKDNGDQIKSLASDPAFAKKVQPLIAQGIRQGYENGDFDTESVPLGGLAHLITLGASQVANALVHSPGAVYKLGGTIAKGDIGVVTGNDQKVTEANNELAQAVQSSVASTKEDFKDPTARPGFLLLDLLGLAAPATRLAAGGRALAAGEGLTGAELAITKKAGGTVAIGREGAQENALLSQNPFVAAAQRYRLERKQAQLNLTTENGAKVPSGLASILQPAAAKDFLDEHFSFEAKIGREADARRKVEHIVNMTVARELDHATGGAIAQSRALARMPSKVRRGLTRGEQKAIQTLSFGVTPDEQIAFHERMIDAGIGDAKAHKRQIADLTLAKKVLADPNPRGRFKTAVDLTQQVVDEMERTKVDQLGLSPVTRVTRPAKPAGTMEAEAGAQTYPATGEVEPFYTKLEPRGKQKRPSSDAPGFYASKPGPFGLPFPTTPPELTHEFTGKAIQAGDFRIDATNLTSEAYGRTVRAATVLNEHNRLWTSATETPKSKWDIPIRDSKKIPDKLRSILGNMDEGVITDKESALLPADMQDLINELYPPLERAQREPIDGVKWVDGRTIGAANEIPSRPGAFVKATEMINEPIRATILFLRPAYALNALGNAGMLLFHQGLAAVPSMARAIGASSELGDETVRSIDALMGQGRSKSYTTAITPKLSHGLAQAWNTVTDQAFRRSSFLYEAKEVGYSTPEELRELVKTGGKDLVEIKRRANKAMVEFDNLTPFEKNTLRHVIFVYPWVSRSVVWSLKMIMDHPLKSAALANLGQQQLDDPVFAQAPDWFKRTGYFPVGWTSDGKPKVVNPSSVNSFSTLGELTSVLGAGFGGTKYASFQDLLGPLPSFAVHGITGKDEYGNDYPDGDWIGAAKEVLGTLPQISAYGRASATKDATKSVDVSKRSSIVAGFNSALKRSVFTPGWLDGYGGLIAGGLSPRGTDLPALAARYWQDATPAERHAHELTLLNSALTIQGGLLKEPVPAAVSKGVKVGSDVDFAYKQFATANGRTPTAKERAGILIDSLEQKGLLPDGQAEKYKQELSPLIAESDIQQLRSQAFDKYGGGDALKQWDSDVRLVASFKREVFNQKTAELYKQGLAKAPTTRVSQEDLYAYGRKYLTFTRKVLGIRDQIKTGDATTADLRAFEDANDKPVGGLPSFVRTAWSYLPADQQKQAIASNAVTAWSSLSSFEKELLGHPADAKVTAGWAKLDDIVAEQRAALARKGESFPSGYRRVLAQYVQKYYDAPGLVKDFDFARQPLYARFQTFKPIQKSPNADKWHQILGAAQTYSKYLKVDGYDKSQVRQMWRDYVANTVQPWIDDDKGFAAEVKSYGKNVMERLIGG